MAIAALEEGLTTPTEKIQDTGRLQLPEEEHYPYGDFHPQCWIYRQYGGNHGWEDLADALRDSCNIYFYTMGHRLGIDKIDAGEIYLRGKKVVIPSFRDAIRLGFALVPEDRKKQGLVQLLSVSRNICMVNMNVVSNGIMVSEAKERARALEYVGKLDISTPSVDTEVQYLSGGNQQKVVIAKWLLQDADIIILDEPTRGIDVGAKSEIYLLINDLV